MTYYYWPSSTGYCSVCLPGFSTRKSFSLPLLILYSLEGSLYALFFCIFYNQPLYSQVLSLSFGISIWFPVSFCWCPHGFMLIFCHQILWNSAEYHLSDLPLTLNCLCWSVCPILADLYTFHVVFLCFALWPWQSRSLTAKQTWFVIDWDMKVERNETIYNYHQEYLMTRQHLNNYSKYGELAVVGGH